MKNASDEDADEGNQQAATGSITDLVKETPQKKSL